MPRIAANQSFATPEMKERHGARYTPEGGVFDALATLLAGTPGATLGVPGGPNRRLGVLFGSGSERLRRRSWAVLPEKPPYVSERHLDLLGVRLPRV